MSISQESARTRDQFIDRIVPELHALIIESWPEIEAELIRRQKARVSLAVPIARNESGALAFELALSVPRAAVKTTSEMMRIDPNQDNLPGMEKPRK